MAFSQWIDRMLEGVQNGLLKPLSEHSDDAGGTLADPAASQGAKVGDFNNFHSLVPHAQTLRQAIFELTADEVVRGGQVTRARIAKNSSGSCAKPSSRGRFRTRRCRSNKQPGPRLPAVLAG
jgi:hypothetical protein